METRVEKWKDYRLEINNNISLQKSVIKTNKKLEVLTRRLNEAYPSYSEKYDTTLFKVEAITKEFGSAPLFPKKAVSGLLEKTNHAFNDDFKLSAISEIDFSDHHLDEIIDGITNRSKKIEKFVRAEDTDEIIINKSKKVKLRSL